MQNENLHSASRHRHNRISLLIQRIFSAHRVHQFTDGPNILFEIVPQKPYPAEYRAVVDQARREIGADYRPALKTDLPDAGRYDVIYIGSPCWWSTVAPPVATFLAAHDFTGKTLIPFMTHEGSRMGRSETDIRRLCPGATVRSGVPIRGSGAAQADREIRQLVEAAGR